MSVDLSTRGHLSDAQSVEIAEIIHHAMLEETFRASRWRPADAVFHGGTALRIMRGSDRFSEDLDFMVREGKAPELDATVGKACDAAARRIQRLLPNSALELKAHARKEGDRIARFSVKWSHPNKMEKVTVKLEFFEAPAERLAGYATEVFRPSGERGPGLAVRMLIPTPALVSAWADKMVAAALREYVKHRDVFDVWFIREQMAGRGDPFEPGAHAGDVLNVAAIYGVGSEAARLRLEAFAGREIDVEALSADLAKWLDPDVHASFADNGSFAEMATTARDDAAEAAAAIAQAPEPRP